MVMLKKTKKKGQWLYFIPLNAIIYMIGLCLCAFQMSGYFENNQITVEEFKWQDHFNLCLI